MYCTCVCARARVCVWSNRELSSSAQRKSLALRAALPKSRWSIRQANAKFVGMGCRRLCRLGCVRETLDAGGMIRTKERLGASCYQRMCLVTRKLSVAACTRVNIGRQGSCVLCCAKYTLGVGNFGTHPQLTPWSSTQRHLIDAFCFSPHICSLLFALNCHD